MNTSKMVKDVEAYINKYATMAESYYTLPVALWAIATHTWPTFDTFPYLVITAFTMRAGKTRLMELTSYIAAGSKTFSPDSPSAMFRSLVEEKPTMFLDEAEKLNAENHPAREMLNKGYRKGQTITRTIGNKVMEFDTFCPKAFVLIGDPYGTLKDRSIMVVMRRRTPIEAASAQKFRMDTVKGEAQELRGEISSTIKAKQTDIAASYADGITLDFLNDRDEEIWQALFAICRVLCPEREQELMQTAVDMCMEKTAAKRKSTGAEWETEERKANEAESRILLLRDMIALAESKKLDVLPSLTIVEDLKAIPTAPWRKFNGKGLNVMDMGNLLDAMNIHPKQFRTGKRKDNKVVRGYILKDLIAAAVLCGLRD